MNTTQQWSNVSIIVCAYTHERWIDLLECLDGLQSQTIVPNQIVISIDHNQELFQQAKSKIQHDNVTIVENKHPRGLSGARNTALEIVSQPIIAFIDEDAVPESNWIENLLACYEDESVLGVGGNIIPNWLGGRPDWFPEEFNWVVGCSYKGLPTQTRRVRNLIGCNMSYRREVFDVVGGFRDGIGRIGTLPVGCEETELCIRAQQEFPQKQFVHNPSAVVKHRVPESRATLQYFRSRCYSEGISKALIATFVGQESALSTETSYVTTTLRNGVLVNLLEFIRGDLSAMGRTLSIIFGLFTTTYGFLRGKVKYLSTARS